METFAVNFTDEFAIKVNYARYRLVQIFAIYAGLIVGKEGAKKVFKQLRKKMRLGEWLRFGLLLTAIARVAPKRYRVYLAHRVGAAAASHPDGFMPSIAGNFHTILDVFEQVDPNGYEELM